MAINGTLILCDSIYQDARSGKFVLSGTYSQWTTQTVPLVLHNLSLYLRFHPDHPGKKLLRIYVEDQAGGRQEHLKHEIEIVAEGVLVTELAVVLPSVAIMPHVPHPCPPNAVLELVYSIGYTLDGDHVASTPLKFFFHQPFIYGVGVDRGPDPNAEERRRD